MISLDKITKFCYTIGSSERDVCHLDVVYPLFKSINQNYTCVKPPYTRMLQHGGSDHATVHLTTYLELTPVAYEQRGCVLFMNIDIMTERKYCCNDT